MSGQMTIDPYAVVMKQPNGDLLMVPVSEEVSILVRAVIEAAAASGAKFSAMKLGKLKAQT